MISKKFIKSSFIYTVIGSLPLLSSVVLLPFYTNMLTTDQFGMLALYIALTAFMQIFVSFTLEQYLAINWVNVKHDVKLTHDHNGTAFSLQLLIGVFFILVYVVSGFFLSGNYPDLPGDSTFEFYPWGFLCLLTAICNSMFKSYSGMLIYQERPIRFFWVSIFNFSLTILISVAIIYYKPFTLDGPMWGRMLSGVGIFFLASFLMYKEYGIAFKTKILGEIFRFSYPMLIYFVLLWAVSNTDRYIIVYFMTASDVAIFDFAIKCTMIIEVVQLGLQGAIIPKIYNDWKETGAMHSTMETNRYFNGFTAMTMLIAPVLVVALPIGVPWVVSNPDFYISFEFLAVLFAAFAISGLKAYFTAPLLYLKKTGALPKVYFVSAVVQIGLTILLVKYFGVWGAVWAFLIVKFIQTVLLYIASKKYFSYKINPVKQIVLPVLYVGLVVLTEIFMVPDYRLWIELALMVIVVVTVFWVYRREILYTVKPLLEKVGLRKKPAA